MMFWFMNFMINSDENKLIDSSVYKMIDFVQTKNKVAEPEIKKELPPEPKEEKEPPKLPDKVVESKSSEDIQEDTPLNMDVPSLDAGMKMGSGMGSGFASMKMEKIDSALTPMVQIKPVYPSRAARMGQEGYVKAELNVDATGRVISVKIVKSMPDGVFDKSAIKALKRWKFRPKTVDGKAIAQTGVITLNYKLGGE
jgi:protein TonB